MGLWGASDPGFLLRPSNRIMALPSYAYYRLLHQGEGKEPAPKGLCEILVSRREGGHLSLLLPPPLAHLPGPDLFPRLWAAVWNGLREAE